MKKLFPPKPLLPSILAMIAASFVFLVCWIFIYFDFANNSIVKALQLTKEGASGWLSNSLGVISVVFSSINASIKAFQALATILLQMPLVPKLMVSTVLVGFSFGIILVIRSAAKKLWASKR